MLGAIIGDIVGSTRERHNIKTEDFELIPEGSRFTDDTVMTLAVAEWLMTDPTHSEGSLIECMQRLGRKYPHAGYGGMFRQWLASDNPQPYGSFGNGSAMRVSPVGLYAKSLDEALELAHITASVTHNHPEGIKGAQAIAACVYMKMKQQNGHEIKNYIARQFGYNLDVKLEEIRDVYTFDVTCQGSVPIAIMAFLQRGFYSAEKALRLAISMGGDSDTIGSMTCAIANAQPFDLIGMQINREVENKCRELLPADLLDINDRFEAFISKPLRQSYEITGNRIYFADEYPGDKEEIKASQKARLFENPTLGKASTVLQNILTDTPKSPYQEIPETKEQVDSIKTIKNVISSCNQHKENLTERVQDCIRGSLMAGAAGDALGYTVEFMSRNAIISAYGKKGITEFELDCHGKALISDDTQMTLFTANGILTGLTRGYMRGIGGRPENYVAGAYLDWYYTQTSRKRDTLLNDFPYTWLRNLPEMMHLRAPGNTCLHACESLYQGKEVQNNSKGCGGIMRVAPMALLNAAYTSKGDRAYSLKELAEAGAVIAEITHRHPLGFLPAALLTVLVYKLVPLSPEEVCERMDELVEETLSILNNIYQGKYEKEKQSLRELTEKAVHLAHSDIKDTLSIRKLGEGWVADEAWAIALYCFMRHINSLKDAITASVNHDGDSDSTGSITGNIIGAIYGYKAIKEQNLFCPEGHKFEETLELHEIILALADDLTTGCPISEYAPIDTPEKRQWYERYCEMKPVGIGEVKLSEPFE